MGYSSENILQCYEDEDACRNMAFCEAHQEAIKKMEVMGFTAEILRSETMKFAGAKNSCASCFSPNAKNVCSRCQDAHYCNAGFQRSDWRFHKIYCKKSASDTKNL